MKSQKKNIQKTNGNTLNIITLIVAVVAIFLASYAILTAMKLADDSHRQGVVDNAQSQKSSENRQAIARLIACQVDPDACDEVDWSRPYHTMRDGTEDYRRLDSQL